MGQTTTEPEEVSDDVKAQRLVNDLQDCEPVSTIEKRGRSVKFNLPETQTEPRTIPPEVIEILADQQHDVKLFPNEVADGEHVARVW